MLDEITIQRLGLIRYIYETAMEESQQPEPFGLISILKFHDSVELFLDLACDKFSIPPNKTQRFRDYWTELEKHLQNQTLSEKRSMERLNDARVSFKHHGSLPHATSIEKFRVNVIDFFEENTPLIFGIEFSKLTMSYLIQQARIRNYLDEANKLLEEGKRRDALTKYAIAFAQLIEDFEISATGRASTGLYFNNAPFLHGVDSGFGHPFQDFGQFVQGVTTSLDNLQQSMQVLSLGIDYPRYMQFRRLTPQVIKMIGASEYQSLYPLKYDNDMMPTTDTCLFCRDFVISSALHIQKFCLEAGLVIG